MQNLPATKAEADALAIAEDRTDAELDEVILAGLGAVTATIAALTVRRKRKTWRATHPTWEAFCRDTYGVSRMTVWRWEVQTEANKSLPPGKPPKTQRKAVSDRQADSVTREGTKSRSEQEKRVTESSVIEAKSTPVEAQPAPPIKELVSRLAEMPSMAWTTVSKDHLRTLRATIEDQLRQRGEVPAAAVVKADPDVERLVKHLSEVAAKADKPFTKVVDEVIRKVQAGSPRLPVQQPTKPDAGTLFRGNVTPIQRQTKAK